MHRYLFVYMTVYVAYMNTNISSHKPGIEVHKQFKQITIIALLGIAAILKVDLQCKIPLSNAF